MMEMDVGQMTTCLHSENLAGLPYPPHGTLVPEQLAPSDIRHLR